MHGFSQGSHTVRDLMLYSKPDVFTIHEHWLTPASLSKLESEFPQYIRFGSSAMSSCVDSGILRGRPFGGVMTLVNRSPSACCRVIDDVIRKVSDSRFSNFLKKICISILLYADDILFFFGSTNSYFLTTTSACM